MKRKLDLLLLPLLLLLVPQSAHAEEPVVRTVLFWAQTYPHCHVVLTETLPPLQEKYGDQLQVLAIEVSDQKGYEQWMLAIETLRIPTDCMAVPMLLIGDRVLVGSYDIPQQLPGLIEKHLDAGGLDYPPIPGLDARLDAAPTVTAPSPTPTPELTAEAVVRLWLFYDSHCDSCLVLKEEILPPILSQYEEGQVEIYEMDLEKGYYEEMLALEAEYGVEYGDMPEIFIGEHALLGNAEIQARMGELIDSYLAQGGVDLVEINLATPETAAEQLPSAAGDPLPIHLAYFYQPGCQE